VGNKKGMGEKYSKIGRSYAWWILWKI